MPQDTRNERPGSQRDSSAEDVSVRDVREILDGRQEVILVHAGERYRLRITSKGKLILTK